MADKISGIQIGLFGTFDVENFGDLLFPFIAEKELSKRLDEVSLRPFSYQGKLSSNWPFQVTSLTELLKTVRDLDGILIGGGHIVRFDKQVAPGYAPPDPSIPHPTGYWLVPALIALQQKLPLIWNAPCVHESDGFPEWSRALLELVLQNSSYISVRDEDSRIVLSRYSGNARITVIPDTAFGISSLLDQQNTSPAFENLRRQTGLTKPYIIIQPTHTTEPFLKLLEKYAEQFGEFHFLVVPISPIHGDQNLLLQKRFPWMVYLNEWPHPLLIAELISQAEAVIGHSYHLSVTALSFGIPVFRSISYDHGKYKALAHFKTIHPLPHTKEDLSFFFDRLGKAPLLPEVSSQLDMLDHHWDEISKILRLEYVISQDPITDLLQSLPNLFEAMEDSLKEKELILSAREDAINSFYTSRAWKLASLLSTIMQQIRRLFKKRI